MSRLAVTCWTIFVIMLGTSLSGGAPVVCVSFTQDVCGPAQAASCCDDPADQQVPPCTDDDDCCIDVLPPNAADTLTLRSLPGRVSESPQRTPLHATMLAIPPPSEVETQCGMRARLNPGSPPDSLAIIRTSRLLI